MQTETQQTAKSISRLIERGGERLWRFADFEGLPPAAVAQTLSRLARAGKLQRLSKGIYYLPRQTSFGKSMASPAALQKLLPKGRAFPSGISAANLLGFTTQMPKQKEIATSAGSLPRKLVGADTGREMQEERRNCFVAITRTIKTLTMTYASKYNGWTKAPSRFLREMGLN